MAIKLYLLYLYQNVSIVLHFKPLHLFWKNILSAMYADWGPPHLTLVVCYIFHLLIPILCKTWLQPPKYLLLFVNRLRYIDDNVTEDRCSIPMDTTVRLGPLKFSLRATINHHGPSIHSGHYTVSINCKKIYILQRSHNYGVWNYWQQKLLYCIYYTIWIDWHMIFGLEQEVGVWSLPWRWHILSILLTTVEGQAPKPVGWMRCFLLMTFVPVQKLCVNE